MFYKINDKYYVKMRNYYKEVIVEDENIIPSKEENTCVYDMTVSVTPISYEDILKSNNFRSFKNREK